MIRPSLLRSAVSLAALALVGGALPAATANAAADTITTHERGVVLACSGEGHGLSVNVDLYTTNVANVPATIVVESAAGIWVPGEGTAEPRIKRGTIKAVAGLVDRESDANEGYAKVTGRYWPHGLIADVHEEIDDAGYHVVSTGTRQALGTSVRVTVNRKRIKLTCSDAFAYDLTVVKTPIV